MIKKNSSPFEEPTDHEIAACAHSIWEAEGRPCGREVAHWFQAKTHLSATRKADAGLLKILEPEKSKPARTAARPPKLRQSSRLAKVA